MRVVIASDHGGFAQKELLIRELTEAGHEITDFGSHSATNPDDYPDYAVQVATAVSKGEATLGILLCRSGEGMEIAANKVRGVRAALVWRPDVAVETRNDNDSNVLVLPSDFVTDHDAVAIAKAFLATSFSNEPRHQRRIDKITALEKGEYES